ncbi:hypothetical protein AQ917_16040, partial [Burkholderia pseudomallei]
MEVSQRRDCRCADVERSRVIGRYPIDHLATVLGHDVVQVKDDFRLWALFLDLQLIGRGHVDCDRFDALGHA